MEAKIGKGRRGQLVVQRGSTGAAITRYNSILAENSGHICLQVYASSDI